MNISLSLGPPILRLNLRAGESTWRFGKEPEWSTWEGAAISDLFVQDYLRGKRVLVLVHGYRVQQPDDAYSRLLLSIGHLYDAIVATRVPLSSLCLGFWFASMRAGKAGKILAKALAPLECACIDIEGHSLGCMVALEALNSGLVTRNTILAAPAVDNESIQRGEKYALAVMRSQRVLVACSHRDEVLAGAYRLGRLDGALGWHGPQDPKECDPRVKVVDCTATAGGHSAYKSDPTFLAAWREIA